MGIWSVFLRQDADNILYGLANIGGVGDFWEVKILWKELDSVCVPSECSGWDVELVTAVVVRRRSNVPTVYTVG